MIYKCFVELIFSYYPYMNFSLNVFLINRGATASFKEEQCPIEMGIVKFNAAIFFLLHGGYGSIRQREKKEHLHFKTDLRALQNAEMCPETDCCCFMLQSKFTVSSLTYQLFDRTII